MNISHIEYRYDVDVSGEPREWVEYMTTVIETLTNANVDDEDGELFTVINSRPLTIEDYLPEHLSATVEYRYEVDMSDLTYKEQANARRHMLDSLDNMTDRHPHISEDGILLLTFDSDMKERLESCIHSIEDWIENGVPYGDGTYTLPFA